MRAKFPQLPPRRAQRDNLGRIQRNSAFTLVEVVLAIGIVAFAFTAVIGLLPTGLATFHRAQVVSVSAQITQVISGDARQAKFAELVSGATPPTLSETRYFDDQGSEVSEPNTAVYAAIAKVNANFDVPAVTREGDYFSNSNLAAVEIWITPLAGKSRTDPFRDESAVEKFTVLIAGKP